MLWLKRLQNPTGRLARWAIRLQPYHFQIIHRKGKDHCVPDCLSRAVPFIKDITPQVMSIETTTESTTDRWYLKMKEDVSQNPVNYPTWRVENNVLYKYLPDRIPQLSSDNDAWRVVVPKDQRSEVFRIHHDIPTGGHFGVFKTYWKIRSKYYWPKMKADVMR